MRYQASLRYLDSFLNLERITFQADNRLWNLRRMRLLLEHFGHPEKSFRPVIIAGTKGKGSTGFMLESLLEAAGLSTGFYNSPHLETPRERIRVQGTLVSKAVWSRNLEGIQKKLARLSLEPRWGAFTYFEIMTLLALLIFREAGARVAILEVGMGGRLDATHAAGAKTAILTPVDYDHQAFLGNTLTQIAGEKAAVIRPGADVICAPQAEAALKVIRRQVRRQKARWHSPALLAGDSFGLRGEFQKGNAASALKAAQLIVAQEGVSLSKQAVARGLRQRSWPGRLEYLKGRPELLIDAAHNPAAMRVLASYLKQKEKGRPGVLLFGTSQDKPSAAMLEILSCFFENVVVTRAANQRSKALSNLLVEAREHYGSTVVAATVAEALEIARRMVPPHGLIVATGSFYLIGELRSLWRGRNSG